MSLSIETKTRPISEQVCPTNPKPESNVLLELSHLEFNIYFDGTWNSKKNSDFYNDPKNLEKDDFKDPKKQKKQYNLGISFARAPTGVDQMHRAAEDKDPYNIALYVDGSGTESWEDHTKYDEQKKEYVEHPVSDNAIGAAFGWFSTGVNGKLDKMFKQIKDKIDKILSTNTVTFSSIIFNVYGFSRGAATARMFCNRVMKQKKIKLKSEYVLEQSDYLDLSPFMVTLKMVGLFDTVSSIGVNHTDDIKANDQDLNFGQCLSGKIVHILAGHEFRQKFNVTSIKHSVLDGNGFELVMPGCHTDIGDGLNTEKKFDEKTKTFENKGETQEVTVLQKLRIYDDEPDDILFPSINPLGIFMPVARTEARARKESNNADFEKVMNYLVSDKWVIKDEEILIENKLLMEKLIIKRKKLSSDYPKIPTFIMVDMVKKFNAYYFKENYLIKYKIETVDDEKLEKMFDNLKKQAFELLEKNISGEDKRFVEMRIQDGSQKIQHEYEGVKIDMPYIDIQGDDDLKKLMYGKYLHWCSSMDTKFLSLAFTQVNIAHINIQTNRFYRNVVEG